MRCDEAVLEIVPFLCGELEERKEKEYRRHTTICKECARYSFKIRKALKYMRENAPCPQEVDISGEIKIRR